MGYSQYGGSDKSSIHVINQMRYLSPMGTRLSSLSNRTD